MGEPQLLPCPMLIHGPRAEVRHPRIAYKRGQILPKLTTDGRADYEYVRSCDVVIETGLQLQVSTEPSPFRLDVQRHRDAERRFVRKGSRRESDQDS